MVELHESDSDYIPTHDSLVLKKEKTTAEQDYIFQPHAVAPLSLSSTQLRKKLTTEHFLLKEWVRCKHGGVMCVRESLAEQRKNIRKVVTSIGANLFKLPKNGGILNISLPVVIFKKESHLQSIATNFSYAPLLFDPLHANNTRTNAAEHLRRFKQCVLFTISVANLGISSEKPFNPILG